MFSVCDLLYILLLLLSLSVVVVVVLVVSTKFGTSAIPDMEGVNYCYLVICFFLPKGSHMARDAHL